MTCACGREVETRFGMTRLCARGAPPSALREVGELDTRERDYRTMAELAKEREEAEYFRRYLQAHGGITLHEREHYQTPADRGERAEDACKCTHCGGDWDDEHVERDDCPKLKPKKPPALPTLEYTPEGPVYRQPIPPPPAPAAEGVFPCWWCGVPNTSGHRAHCPYCDQCNSDPAVPYCGSGKKWDDALAEVRLPGFVPRRLRASPAK